MHQGALLSPDERLELTRRYYGVLLYVLRCPAYHRLTQRQLQVSWLTQRQLQVSWLTQHQLQVS